MTPLSILLVQETVLGVSNLHTVFRHLEILKMFYPPKGLCKAEPNGVHFDSFHFIVFEKGCLDLSFQER